MSLLTAIQSRPCWQSYLALRLRTLVVDAASGGAAGFVVVAAAIAASAAVIVVARIACLSCLGVVQKLTILVLSLLCLYQVLWR